MISVLLVEDDARTARFLREAIQQDSRFRITRSVSTIRAAKEALAADPSDVVLLDLVLQKVERSREIGSLKAVAPQAKVIALTAYEDSDLILRALSSGADGYLLKTDSLRPLTTAITECLEFGTAFSPTVANAVVRHFHRIGQEQQRSQLDQLTAQESRVLALLSQGYRNKEIAVRLHIEPVTVKKHIEALCRKLRVRNRTQAAVLVRLFPSWLQ